jgi:hypothetical protein
LIKVIVQLLKDLDFGVRAAESKKLQMAESNLFENTHAIALLNSSIILLLA